MPSTIDAPSRSRHSPGAASSTTQREIVLFGLFGGNNFGNNASLAAMIHNLRARRPDAAITVVCANPSVVGAEHNVRALPLDLYPPRFVWRLQNRTLRRLATAALIVLTEPLRRRMTVRALSNSRHFIVVGTGALDDFTTAFWEMPMDILRWCTAARRVGAKVSFLSVGAGPIHNPLSRSLMLRALSKSDYRSYRDDVSKHYLTDVGFDASQDDVFPDLVFRLPIKAPIQHSDSRDIPKVVGLGVMGYYGWQNARGASAQRTFDQYAGKLIQFIAWLQARGYVVRLLIGELGVDTRAVRDILARLGSSPDVRRDALLWEPIESFNDLCDQISSTDIVVATRFHNLVAALMYNKPVISIGYSSKNDALLKDFGLHDYCQSIDTFNVPTLISQFETVCTEYNTITARIARTNEQKRRRLDECFDALFSSL